MPKSTASLEDAFRVFEKHRKEWFATHPGQYVVLHNSVLFDFFPDYESAVKAGVKEFGVQSTFLVQQVCREEPVFVIY